MSVTDLDCVLSAMQLPKLASWGPIFIEYQRFGGTSINLLRMLKYKTKQDQEELGTQSIVEGSKFVSQEAVLLKGTSFAVKNFLIFQLVVIFKVRYCRISSYCWWISSFGTSVYLFYVYHNG
jgi:hypothetical protein